VVVGYCILQGNYISKLLVIESKRRCGVGTLLIDQCISRCRESRLGSMSLHVGSEREGALRLYEKKGFTVGKRIKDYYIEGRDAFHMEMKIV
jgi:ribosomal protein S18 acetylase RimI-like enzyme